MEGRRFIHQVGFMPGSESKPDDVIAGGHLKSDTGLLWLRPARFINMIFGHAAEMSRAIWVEFPGELKLLRVKTREELAKKTGVQGHTDEPAVAIALAKRLREMGYDGFERSDFPEVAVLSDVPHQVVGRV